ncbi:MAG: alpha-amylase family glycosyl hydrolase [Bacillus sp. (in: Bacteria)]|nr:alpha-amylase family glycosyl hydrolase [Bacillus sp. (in: firmicutes)]MCM1425699.1 alpha-amylase family glycosyl hydrolase [Eubacterium sp.]
MKVKIENGRGGCRRKAAFLLLICMLIMTACGKGGSASGDITDDIPLNVIDDNYRTYYEVFVYSFYDSDGDGIGDLQGLISKLDYINDGDDTTDTDLGCNGIWLMPINPSPTYHKYDVVDYYDIDPAYGTLEDFQELLAACDKRGIKVIMDLVLNHSSSQNPWFLQACDYLKNLGDKEPDASECPYFAYYHFSKEAQDGYCAVEGTDWYYEAQFWSEMPDLNLDCEALRAEIEDITKYWLDMGVGGFRLDAVKEYYSGDTQANVDFLEWFTDVVKAQKEDAYLVGEAWLNINEYAKYYESGMDSLFNFAFSGAEGVIAKVMNGSSAEKYGDACASLQEEFGQYNENYIDAPFYTNHDMARSVGYYVGEHSQNRVKLAGAMNLFMSGSAFIYYGEELGMKGSGKDENKRAPMYWSKDEESAGMCDGPADMDDFEMKYESLEEQEKDETSIYQYYKKAVKIRNQNPEIARGSVEYLSNISGENFCVLKKTWNGTEIILIFHTGAETENFDLTELTVNGKEVSHDSVRAMLESGEESIVLDNGQAIMPGYSVLALK